MLVVGSSEACWAAVSFKHMPIIGLHIYLAENLAWAPKGKFAAVVG